MYYLVMVPNLNNVDLAILQSKAGVISTGDVPHRGFTDLTKENVRAFLLELGMEIKLAEKFSTSLYGVKDNFLKQQAAPYN